MHPRSTLRTCKFDFLGSTQAESEPGWAHHMSTRDSGVRSIMETPETRPPFCAKQETGIWSFKSQGPQSPSALHPGTVTSSMKDRHFKKLTPGVWASPGARQAGKCSSCYPGLEKPNPSGSLDLLGLTLRTVASEGSEVDQMCAGGSHTRTVTSKSQ